MPAIIRPRNADGTFGEPAKFGKGHTTDEKVEYLATDVEVVAETAMLNADDVLATAETVAMLMDVIIDMQAQIDELKGGIA